VTSLVVKIRSESPALGLSKLLQSIKLREPTWILSEKARSYKID
jgi:hypothetical protein